MWWINALQMEDSIWQRPISAHIIVLKTELFYHNSSTKVTNFQIIEKYFYIEMLNLKGYQKNNYQEIIFC